MLAFLLAVVPLVVANHYQAFNDEGQLLIGGDLEVGSEVFLPSNTQTMTITTKAGEKEIEVHKKASTFTVHFDDPEGDITFHRAVQFARGTVGVHLGAKPIEKVDLMFPQQPIDMIFQPNDHASNKGLSFNWVQLVKFTVFDEDDEPIDGDFFHNDPALQCMNFVKVKKAKHSDRIEENYGVDSGTWSEPEFSYASTHPGIARQGWYNSVDEDGQPFFRYRGFPVGYVTNAVKPVIQQSSMRDEPSPTRPTIDSFIATVFGIRYGEDHADDELIPIATVRYTMKWSWPAGHVISKKNGCQPVRYNLVIHSIGPGHDGTEETMTAARAKHAELVDRISRVNKPDPANKEFQCEMCECEEGKGIDSALSLRVEPECRPQKPSFARAKAPGGRKLPSRKPMVVPPELD